MVDVQGTVGLVEQITKLIESAGALSVFAVFSGIALTYFIFAIVTGKFVLRFFYDQLKEENEALRLSIEKQTKSLERLTKVLERLKTKEDVDDAK